MNSLREHRFVIPGKPMPWQRAGYNRKTKAHYTPEETRNYQTAVRSFACLSGVRPFEGRVGMELRIFFPDNRVRDDDNVEKSIRDALQANRKHGRRAIAFTNDNQVRHVLRIVGDPDPVNPRVEVLIWELP